jgi:hypothetical protein
MRKKLEHSFKAVVQDGKTISGEWGARGERLLYLHPCHAFPQRAMPHAIAPPRPHHLPALARPLLQWWSRGSMPAASSSSWIKSSRHRPRSSISSCSRLQCHIGGLVWSLLRVLVSVLYLLPISMSISLLYNQIPLLSCVFLCARTGCQHLLLPAAKCTTPPFLQTPSHLPRDLSRILSHMRGNVNWISKS